MFNTDSMVDRAPDWCHTLAFRVAAGEGVLGRIADATRFRYTEDQIPQLPPPGEGRVRLVIGPANSAGQGYEWARAVERCLTGVSAFSVLGVDAGPFQPAIDLRIPVAVYQRAARWHDTFEAWLTRQTHVVWESGHPLLGRRHHSDPETEMRQLDEYGVKGALLFHGSDIRPPARHAAQSEWSPFRQRSWRVRASAERAASNAALADRLGVPVFVSTPDLLQWMPQAIWCPVVVDAQRWRNTAVVPTADRPPVVVHAPSTPRLKGTSLIEPMLHRLHDEGVIEFRQTMGIPHAAMPAFYGEADIVLDQFLLGIYGVAACEAMAAGTLVMSHVDDFTRARVREQTGLELPVHEATIETLETELRRAAAEPAAFEQCRVAGPAFVSAVHDGRRSAAALASFLGLSA